MHLQISKQTTETPSCTYSFSEHDNLSNPKILHTDYTNLLLLAKIRGTSTNAAHQCIAADIHQSVTVQ